MTSYPLLLTRQQASDFLGIDPKSFDTQLKSKIAEVQSLCTIDLS